MSPDEHFEDIKRILSAECGHARKRTIVMPYLYQSRQDKRDSRESLDCAVALEELRNMGANEIITCDVHNRGVGNAVHNTAFESVKLGDILLYDLLENEGIADFSKFVLYLSLGLFLLYFVTYLIALFKLFSSDNIFFIFVLIFVIFSFDNLFCSNIF